VETVTKKEYGKHMCSKLELCFSFLVCLTALTNCIDKIALNEGIIIIDELIIILKEVFVACFKALVNNSSPNVFDDGAVLL
jgi:hypothetical protein